MSFTTFGLCGQTLGWSAGSFLKGTLINSLASTLGSICDAACDWSVLALYVFEFGKGHFQIGCKQAHITNLILFSVFSFYS